MKSSTLGLADKPMPQRSSTPTARQADYLKFIELYRRMLGCSPSEADAAAFFGVAPPTAHNMFVTLDKKGVARRLPGSPRSIRSLVGNPELPELGQVRCSLWQDPPSSPNAALRFVGFVAVRLLRGSGVPLVGYAAMSRMALRAEPFLLEAGLERHKVQAFLAQLVELAWQSDPTGTVRRGSRGIEQQEQHKKARATKRRLQADDPDQLTLFAG